MSHFSHILKGIVSQSSGVDADLAIYLASLTTPLSAGQIAKLNTFVTSLKSGLGITNLSDAFDLIQIYANETAESGLKNLVKRSHDAFLTATQPTFTALEGFAGNGSSSALEVNYIPKTDGSKMTNTFSSTGVYFRTFEIGTNKFNGVYSTVGNGGVNAGIAFAAGSVVSKSMQLTSAQTGISDSNTNGFYIITRNDDLVQKKVAYRNKNIIEQVTTATAGLPDQSMALLARRTTNGTLGLWNTSQVAFHFMGKYFTATEVGIITDTFEAYMVSNEKGII